MSIASQARQYSENHGLYLFPVQANKAPVTPRGFKEATTDPERLARWFRVPGRGMGWHPGPSGFVVVDIDVKDGAQGEEEWRELGVDSPAPEVLTPSGGRHLWFRKPEGTQFTNRSLSPSIDIRGDNGYAILPETPGYSWSFDWGDKCEKCDFYHPEFAHAPLFPQSLIDKIGENDEFHPGEVERGPILAGSRYDTLFRAGRKMQFQGIPEEGILEALLAMNRERCQPPHSEAHVRKIVRDIMAAEPPINPKTGATEPGRELIRIRSGEGQPLSWPTVWSKEYPPIDWVQEMEGIALTGRATNLYGPAGTGKSELVLYRAALSAQAGSRILWLDREMTEADVKDRLMAMGFEPKDLGSLFYILYPDIALLDKPEGGERLVELANQYAADATIIDSLSKFVRDEEGETHTAFYVNTMLPMRLAGRGFVMIDHAGKDLARKARGASQKVDNVDYYTELTRTLAGSRLTTKKQRHSWVHAQYDFNRTTDPIKYELSKACVICGRPATHFSIPKWHLVCAADAPPGAIVIPVSPIRYDEEGGEESVENA